jgi:lipopolysaccharide biosynthesis regulator YciM
MLEIYQREKEWRRAIDAAQALQDAGAGSRQKEIAQLKRKKLKKKSLNQLSNKREI